MRDSERLDVKNKFRSRVIRKLSVSSDTKHAERNDIHLNTHKYYFHPLKAASNYMHLELDSFLQSLISGTWITLLISNISLSISHETVTYLTQDATLHGAFSGVIEMSPERKMCYMTQVDSQPSSR
jgi:hypothetical protein